MDTSSYLGFSESSRSLGLDDLRHDSLPRNCVEDNPHIHSDIEKERTQRSEDGDAHLSPHSHNLVATLHESFAYLKQPLRRLKPKAWKRVDSNRSAAINALHSLEQQDLAQEVDQSGVDDSEDVTESALEDEEVDVDTSDYDIPTDTPNDSLYSRQKLNFNNVRKKDTSRRQRTHRSNGLCYNPNANLNSSLPLFDETAVDAANKRERVDTRQSPRHRHKPRYITNSHDRLNRSLPVVPDMTVLDDRKHRKERVETKHTTTSKQQGHRKASYSTTQKRTDPDTRSKSVRKKSPKYDNRMRTSRSTSRSSNSSPRCVDKFDSKMIPKDKLKNTCQTPTSKSSRRTKVNPKHSGCHENQPASAESCISASAHKLEMDLYNLPKGEDIIFYPALSPKIKLESEKCSNMHVTSRSMNQGDDVNSERVSSLPGVNTKVNRVSLDSMLRSDEIEKVAKHSTNKGKHVTRRSHSLSHRANNSIHNRTSEQRNETHPMTNSRNMNESRRRGPPQDTVVEKAETEKSHHIHQTKRTDALCRSANNSSPGVVGTSSESVPMISPKRSPKRRNSHSESGRNQSFPEGKDKIA